jgi:hypothetical protein
MDNQSLATSPTLRLVRFLLCLSGQLIPTDTEDTLITCPSDRGTFTSSGSYARCCPASGICYPATTCISSSPVFEGDMTGWWYISLLTLLHCCSTGADEIFSSNKYSCVDIFIFENVGDRTASLTMIDCEPNGFAVFRTIPSGVQVGTIFGLIVLRRSPLLGYGN